MERQIRTNALLSRQLQEEERCQVLKQNYQIECDDPFNYHIDTCQVKLENNHEPTSGTEEKPVVRFSTHQLSDYHNR